MPDTFPSATGRTRPRVALPGSSLVWWALAAVALVLGFVTLWTGSETLAPVLLVVGYCVLVPIAILKR